MRRAFQSDRHLEYEPSSATRGALILPSESILRIWSGLNQRADNEGKPSAQLGDLVEPRRSDAAGGPDLGARRKPRAGRLGEQQEEHELGAGGASDSNPATATAK